MSARAFFSSTLTAFLLVQSAPAFGAFAPTVNFVTLVSGTPIDAFSVRMTGTTFRYEYGENGTWSQWQTHKDDGDNGAGEESELIMVPSGVTGLRVIGIASVSDIHPITVSKNPVNIRVASTKSVAMPSVLSRADWGADDSYLYAQPKNDDAAAGGDVAKGDNGVGSSTQSNNRVNDCMTAQQNYPSEFNVDSTVRMDRSGRNYSWPLQYSKEVRLLVVHHSALLVQGDPRPPEQRVRALYKYHAINKGWGDIGYNFIVDENGQVYEGRQGGKGVIGGHAYCNNTGTIGIVVMGNFELEEPSQAQVRGLQRLLASLAQEYNIDVNRSVQFHGKVFAAPIVGHRDLLSTLCPGYSLLGSLAQIVGHVQAGSLDAPVNFPPPRSSSSSSSSAAYVQPGVSQLAAGVTFIGRTSISINPGGKQRLSFTYTAGEAGAYEGKKIGDVRLSTPNIKAWLDDGLHQIPVTKGILLDTDLPAGESSSIQLIVQAPMDAGSYAMDIAGLHFTLSVFGRRARTGEFINPFGGNPAMVVRPAVMKKSTALKTVVRPSLRSPQSSSSSSTAISSFSSSVVVGTRESHVPTTNAVSGPVIRVRLSASPSPVITFTDAGTINGNPVRAGTSLQIIARGSQCQALAEGSAFAQDSVLRLKSTVSDTLTIHSVRSKIGLYKGTIECSVIDGALTLIDELALDDYMTGIAEEPDTEPYQKQRAFAIAARTYAAYYMQPSNRKFPGMPYDASDDPAVFQSYLGLNFAGSNPQWTNAVASTAGQVLKSGGRLIKPPYFSSDDGRTRTPTEAGWKNFPFSGIFTNKPDPWCKGLPLAGHGVGMSGCGAKGQALEGRSAEQILQYYYPGVRIGESIPE